MRLRRHPGRYLRSGGDPPSQQNSAMSRAAVLKDGEVAQTNALAGGDFQAKLAKTERDIAPGRDFSECSVDRDPGRAGACRSMERSKSSASAPRPR